MQLTRGHFVTTFEGIPDLDVDIDRFACRHRAARASTVFLDQVAAGHPAHHSLERRPGQLAEGSHDVQRVEAFFLHVVDTRDLAQHQGNARRCQGHALRRNVVLNPDRQRARSRGELPVELDRAIGTRMSDIGRHGDDRVRMQRDCVPREPHGCLVRSRGDPEHDW